MYEKLFVMKMIEPSKPENMRLKIKDLIKSFTVLVKSIPEENIWWKFRYSELYNGTTLTQEQKHLEVLLLMCEESYRFDKDIPGISLDYFFPPIKPTPPLLPQYQNLENYPSHVVPAVIENNSQLDTRYVNEVEWFDAEERVYPNNYKVYEDNLSHNTQIMEKFFEEINFSFDKSCVLFTIRKLLLQSVTRYHTTYEKMKNLYGKFIPEIF